MQRGALKTSGGFGVWKLAVVAHKGLYGKHDQSSIGGLHVRATCLAIEVKRFEASATVLLARLVALGQNVNSLLIWVPVVEVQSVINQARCLAVIMHRLCRMPFSLVADMLLGMMMMVMMMTMVMTLKVTVVRGLA